jgi:hypothetical protein
MVTGVEMEFSQEPTENDIQSMRMAAEKLAKDPIRIEIRKSDGAPNKATVIFRMKNEAQYKVVDMVAHTFKYALPNYRDIIIWFRQEKAYDLQNPRSIHN